MKTRMKMRSVIWMMLIPSWAWSFVISGLWKTNNVLIHIQDNKLTGMFQQSIVEMNIDCHLEKNKVRLFNFQVVKKPSDWYNVSKYKGYMRIFQKIKKDGLECELSFIEKDMVRVGSFVEGKQYELFLSRMKEHEKNDLNI